MEKEIKQFLEWLSRNKDTSLPDYEALPKVPLYMEQVVGYVNEVVEPLLGNGKSLTPFMVNNYVKAKIIEVPEGKKYNHDHIGYLLAITLLKQSLTMDEIAMLIALDSGISQDKSKLYRFFSSMEHDINMEVSERVGARIEDYLNAYKKGKRWVRGKEASKELRDALGLVALRLAIYSSIYQRVSEKLLGAIGKDLYGEAGLKVAQSPSHKEDKELSKVETRAAKRLAYAQDIAARRAKEKEMKKVDSSIPKKEKTKKNEKKEKAKQ